MKVIYLILYLNLIIKNERTKANIKFFNLSKKIEFNYLANNNEISLGQKIATNLLILELDDKCNLKDISYTGIIAIGFFLNKNCNDKIYEIIKNISYIGPNYIFILTPLLINHKNKVLKKLKKYSLEIPLFYLENDNNKIILEKLDKSKPNPIKIEYEENISTITEINFYFLMSDINSFEIFENLKKIYKTYKEKINLNFYPGIFSNLEDKNCFKNKNYCTIPINNNLANGNNLLNDILILNCVNKSGIDYLFKFVSIFKTKCLNNYKADCSKKIIKEVDSKWNIENCLKESPKCENKNCNIKILDFYNNNSITNIYPLLKINDNVYKGSFRLYDILFTICSTFDIKLNQCKDIESTNKFNNKNLKLFLIFLLTSFILLIFILYCICKKCAYKNFKKQLGDSVKKYVNENSSIKQI